MYVVAGNLLGNLSQINDLKCRMNLLFIEKDLL